jgi:O-antigen/teichoic acid export membrane protein
LADNVCGTLAGVLALICVPAIILSNVFLKLWIGPEFAVAAAPLMRTLLFGTWVNGIAFVPFALLQAQGRPDVVAKFHALEIVPFIAVLWASIALLGLPGAALSWVLRVLVDTTLLYWAVGSAFDRAKRALPVGCIVVAAWMFMALCDPEPAIAVLMAFGASVCLCWWIAATDPTARAWVARVGGMWRKVNVS